MSLESDIKQLAQRFHNSNTSLNERLESLALAVQPGADPGGWAGVDVLRMLDPAGTAAALRDRPLGDARLARLERWRNFLALLPVLLTWLGLTFAATGYRMAIEADPALIDRPFLLLWEEGFRGYVTGPASLLRFFTLSHVAIGDVLLLSIMLILTWRIHGEMNVVQSGREREAHEVESQLHQVAWQASLELAERTSLATAIERFQEISGAQLDELRAERERIGQLADQREREMQDLNSFAQGLTSGTNTLVHYADQVKAQYGTLVEISAKQDDHLVTLVNQQATLNATLLSLNAAVVADRDAHLNATKHLSTTLQQLKESADESVKATGLVTEGTNKIQFELGELRTQLQKERKSYQKTAEWANQSATKLREALDGLSAGAQAIKDTAPILSGVAKQLAGISQELKQSADKQAAAAAAIDVAAKTQGNAATAITSASEKQGSAATAIEAAAERLVAVEVRPGSPSVAKNGKPPGWWSRLSSR